MAKAWMRQLQVILTSNALRKRMTFGTNDNRGKDDLSISITGTKYMSSLKDAFTIKLVNLSYFEICELINGQYYDVEIKAGYKSAGLHTIFKGGVLYISNVFGDRKSNECMIFCASNLIAKYGQSRMNLGLNSGINMYAGIKFIAKAAGIGNSNVDESFKLKIFRACEESTGTLANWLDVFCNSNNVCIPQIFNLSLVKIKSETFVRALEKEEVYISTTTACSSLEPSVLLNELTDDKSISTTSVRISISPYTTNDEIDRFLVAFHKTYDSLLLKE